MNLETVRKLEQKPSHIFSHRQYFFLALPLIISGISTPLLGVVDTAVVGRIEDSTALGGVAIGAVIFNTMYWLLGFLRVSTSGFTSQADGAKNEMEVILAFIRPFLIATFMGLFFLVFQKPILHIALFVIGGNESVSSLAATYYSIRIWGAPFILLSYVMIGWLVGLGKVKLSLFLQIGMNLLNIALDMVFVLGLDMGVAGVAYATLLAEVTAVILGGWIIYRNRLNKTSIPTISRIFQRDAFTKMFLVNRDHFLRTLCLVTMTAIFTAKGASMGEITLAANAILLQIHYVMAYLFGGFANASSILVGRSIGGKQISLYLRSISLSAQWGLGTAVILSLGIFIFGEQLVTLFTTIPEVIDSTIHYVKWLLLYPLFGFWGLQLEGIFSGATDAKSIRDSIFLAFLVFLLSIWLLVPLFQNDGVWMSFIIFSFGRSVFLSLFIPKLTDSIKVRGK